jgi:hypothetical protein
MILPMESTRRELRTTSGMLNLRSFCPLLFSVEAVTAWLLNQVLASTFAKLISPTPTGIANVESEWVREVSVRNDSESNGDSGSVHTCAKTRE